MCQFLLKTSFLFSFFGNWKWKKKKNDHISISIVNDIHQVNIQQPLRAFFFNEKKEPIRIVDIHVADYFFHDDVSSTSKF